MEQRRYAGVCSTFLLHTKRLGEKYGVDPLKVLVELGRRKTMAGQEDMVLDVTLELARTKRDGFGDVAFPGGM